MDLQATLTAQEAHIPGIAEATAPAVRRYVDATGPLNVQLYVPPAYLADVRRRNARTRLAQLSIGSHWLHEETGRWRRVPRDGRVCQRCGAGELDDAGHMVFRCAALADVRRRHAGLL